MYASISNTTPHRTTQPHSSTKKLIASSSFFGSLSSVYNPPPNHLVPSGCPTSSQESPQFERQLQDLLARLINANTSDSSKQTPRSHPPKKVVADQISHNSFNFNPDDDTFGGASDSSRSPSRRRPANHASFDRSNVDDIDTKFTKQFMDNIWNFSAGSPTTEKPATGQPNPTSPNAKQEQGNAGASSEVPPYETGFNPTGWSDKFGPQTFVPQQAAGAASPTKTSRTNSRKSKTTKSNANNPIVINDSDDEDLYEWPGRKPQAQGQTNESPQAMDIDTPPVVPPRPPPEARGIYVEPTRPEWRSDEAQNATPASHTGVPSVPHAGGSEDSEEFRASFADLKNVAPFAQQKQGLKGLSELKDNLPFDSKPGKPPLHIPKATPLVFPALPLAPNLPPTVAIENMIPNAASWNKYLDDFGMYLQEWELFNAQVVDHFATRNAHIKRLRESKGYAFLGSRSENEIQEYMSWVHQDNDVRQRWNAACEDHERRFREFMAFRNKMKA